MTQINLIKIIREKTSLSFKDIKKAIETVGENEENVIKYLREQGLTKSQARSDRTTSHGGIFTYNHENKLAVVVELRSETDFVSRSEVFKVLGNDLALHAAAYRPQFYGKNEVDQDYIDKEIEIARVQLEKEGKNNDMIEKILLGKKNKIVEEVSMESQDFLKDPKITVAECILNVSQETGEKIEVAYVKIFSLT